MTLLLTSTREQALVALLIQEASDALELGNNYLNDYPLGLMV